MARCAGTVRVVVGVDGSDPSLRALAKAVSLASSLNTTVQIVTTWKYFAAYADISISEWSPENARPGRSQRHWTGPG